MAAQGLQQDDIVCVFKKGKGYNYGVILENADSSDSSDEEDADEDRLKKGFVRVAWYPSGRETVLAENKVKLLDRSLEPGETVQRLVPDQGSQSGIIIDMETKCHLHIKKTNQYIYNVPTKDLTPLQKFDMGQDVVLDDMLGRVVYVNLYVIISFPDGARCKVEGDSLSNYNDINEKRERHGEFGFENFYEGQELRGSLDELSEAEWLHSTSRYSSKTVKKKGSNVTVTIDKIVIDSVDVQWIFKIFFKDNPALGVNLPETAVKEQHLERMKILDSFEYRLRMGDRRLYQIKNEDFISYVEPCYVEEPTCLTAKDIGNPVPSSQPPEEAVEGANTVGAVSDLAVSEVSKEYDGDDDDEEYEDDSDDAAVEDADHRDVRFTGNKAAKRKKKGAVKGAGNKSRFGKTGQRSNGATNHKKATESPVTADSMVEVEVVYTSTLSSVLWQDGSVDNDIPTSDLNPVEPDLYEFFPGDFVQSQAEMDIKPDYGAVLKCNHADRTCHVNWYKAYDGVTEKEEPHLLQSNVEVSVYDIKDHTVYNFHIGEIVGLIWITSITETETENSWKTGAGRKFVGRVIKLAPPGRLTVKWSDDSISQCFPQDVFRVFEDDDDDDDSSDDDSWEDESERSSDTWETESEHEVLGEEIMDKDEKTSPAMIAKQKQELQSLLARAESALIRLKTLLNSFDVSVTAPECFHDIIRIYRSCHDVDKILHSSFFSDPELQNLIAQAKFEVKTSKMAKHYLGRLVDTFDKMLTDCDVKKGKLGASFSCDLLDLRIEVMNQMGGASAEGSEEKNKEEEKIRVTEASEGATVVSDVQETISSEQNGTSAVGTDEKTKEEQTIGEEDSKDASGASSPNSSFGAKNKVLRKEYSEPIISSRLKEKNDSGECIGGENQASAVDLVGENCVEKTAKPAAVGTNHTKDLCYKICENLQKQILKIQEEVDKRTDRMNSSEQQSDTSSAAHVHEQEENMVYDISSCAEDPNSIVEDELCSKEKSKSFNQDKVKAEDTSQDGLQQTTNPESGPAKEADGSAAQSDSAVSMETQVGSEEASPEELLKGFDILEDVSYNKFSSQVFQPLNQRTFNNAIKKELRLLQYSLPDGIFIKGFESRLDLYSVMIHGPIGTPYEDAVFLFDFMLPKDYPNSPPLCHYHSFCSDRLNPNLYEDGKVCVSLLGTWNGKGNEMWTSKSNLLQVLVSIQGLILVREPYYNEAGFEKQRGTHVGKESSRMYNEMAIVKTVQSLAKMCQKLPNNFESEIRTHLKKNGPRLLKRLRRWLAKKDEYSSHQAETVVLDADSSSVNNLPDTDKTEMDVEGSVSCKASSHLNGNHLSCDSNVDGENDSEDASSKTLERMQESSVDDDEAVAKDKDWPEFSLFPISRGFCLTLGKALDSCEKALELLNSS